MSATQTHRGSAHDAFGLHEAVAEAAITPPTVIRAVSRLEDWALTLLAVLPIPVVVGVTFLATVRWPDPLSVVATALVWTWVLGFVAVQLGVVGAPVEAREVTVGTGNQQAGRVIVVGAGPVGLAVVKECVEAGIDVVCFERQDGPGGVFRYNETFSGGVWQSCTLTSSPWVTAFADHPPEDDSSVHLHHSVYRQYLEAYVDRFGFQDRLHFGHTVERAADEDGRWVVDVRGPDGRMRTERGERLVVCAGLNLQPKEIGVPGLEGFTGEVMHVADYRSPEGLEGKRVVIAGSGESGVDIAAEIADVAASTALSIPRGKFIIPRINPDNGIANDYDTSRIRYASPHALRNWFMLAKERRAATSGSRGAASAFRSRLLATAGVGPMSQTATKNDDFVARALDGRLEIRTRIVAFDGDEVVHEDGRREPADVVIFAHGYNPRFPFLELPEGVAKRHPGLLYLRMFVPEVGGRLAFCGFARPAIGAIPPIGELQARLFVQVAKGERRLPDPGVMRAGVVRMLDESARLYPGLVQPNVVVSFIRYMDQLAAMIGCRPSWRLVFRDPKLAWRVIRGPVTGASYRVSGPGGSDVARDTVRRLKGTHPTREMLTMTGLYFWIWPLALVHQDVSRTPHNTFL